MISKAHCLHNLNYTTLTRLSSIFGSSYPEISQLCVTATMTMRQDSVAAQVPSQGPGVSGTSLLNKRKPAAWL